jgi:hypothetical protein
MIDHLHTHTDPFIHLFLRHFDANNHQSKKFISFHSISINRTNFFAFDGNLGKESLVRSIQALAAESGGTALLPFYLLFAKNNQS